MAPRCWRLPHRLLYIGKGMRYWGAYAGRERIWLGYSYIPPLLKYLNILIYANHTVWFSMTVHG